MENTISIIADICAIVAFFLSLYAASGVYTLKKESNKVNVSGSAIGGDFVGRDKKTH